MKRVLALKPLVVCGILCGAACVEAPADSGWVVDRSRAGDTLTVLTVSGQVWPSSMAPVIDLSIGVLEGDASLIFGDVVRLAEDGAGGVYVLDWQGPIIRHYNAVGDHVGDVGGPGEGPGEYSNFSLGMVVDPDGVLHMSDWGNGRIARFSADGEALDAWRVEQSLTTAPGRWVFSDGAGRLLLRTREADRQGLLVIDGGQVVDTLWVPEMPGLPDRAGGPYRVDRYWGWHPAGYFVVGVSDSYSIDHRRPNEVLRFGRMVDPMPVHPDEADQVRRSFEWMEAQPMYRPPEGEWIPDHMPPFRGLQVADDGNVWVRRNVVPIPIERTRREGSPPPITWRQPHVYDVFDADGRYLGEVAFPHNIEPLLFGEGTIWGVRRGSFDEQYVVRMSLAPMTESG